MEPTIPTSFIPKRPIESSTVPERHSSGGSVGLLSLLAFVIVVGTVVAFVGVYFYQQQLNSQKEKLEESIAQARDGIGTDFVYDMKRLDARITGVKDIIKNHIVVTPIFDALQDSTLRSVQYRDFSYTIKTDTVTKVAVLDVSLSGTAKNYSTIALQSDAFSSNPLIKNPVFSNLTVDDKTRAVNFKLGFSVNVEDLSYQKFVDSMTKTKTVTPPTNPITP